VKRIAAVVAVVALVMTACGGSSKRSAATTEGASLAGPLTVFAAASLTGAFNDDKGRLATKYHDLSVTFSFAGSQQLVAQIQAGAPADVVATADEPSMQPLVAAGLVEQPRIFARNVLQIAVAAGNPKHIAGLADLGRRGLRVVLADPSVPVGRYSRQVLDRQHVVVHPLSLELDVKSALRKVQSGEADAAIVYATDVRAGGSSVNGVAIPADQNTFATYPAAVMKGTSHRAAAETFIDQLVSGDGQRALQAAGFTPPT
jgi:molybdate transport system substrate-binding protein